MYQTSRLNHRFIYFYSVFIFFSVLLRLNGFIRADVKEFDLASAGNIVLMVLVVFISVIHILKTRIVIAKEDELILKYFEESKTIDYKDILEISRFSFLTGYGIFLKYYDREKSKPKSISFLPETKAFAKSKMLNFIIEKAKTSNPDSKVNVNHNFFSGILLPIIVGIVVLFVIFYDLYKELI